MTTFNELVSSQQHHESTGGTFIGSLIWWSLNGNRISHIRLQELATQHNLPDRYLPAPVKPTSAFRRAWRSAITKLPPGLLLRQITESVTALVLGLVEEKADAQNESLVYNQLATVTFDKNAGTITVDPPHHFVDTTLHNLYAHHLELTTTDIRAMLSAFVAEAGVSLRESGGVYFIAAPHQATIEAMSAVIQAIGHNHLYQLPLYNSPLAQATLSGLTVTTLDDEIRNLQEELKAFIGDDKTRRSTLEKRLAVFDALRNRVETFAGVLSFKSSDLLERVSALQTDLRQHLGVMDHKTTPTAADVPLLTEFPQDLLNEDLELSDDNDLEWPEVLVPQALAFDPDAGF